MSASVEAGFLALSVLTALAGWMPAQTIGGGNPVIHPLPPVTAPYDVLTNDLTEFANFHPEPFAGIALDVDGGILAVNPYNNTWIRYASPTATSMSLRALTGHNPVSIGVWNPGPTPADRRVLVVCTGSHAIFMHDPIDGRILNVLRLDSEPADLEIDGEAPRAFVSCRGSNTVVEIHLPSFTVADTYPIGCGQRPGPLYLDPGNPQSLGDERVYVAAMVTGNNSIFAGPMDPVGFVLDLDNASLGDLPDQDIFRINPAQVGENAVAPVVRRAGSLIFELGRQPGSNDLWILSTDSHNKGPETSEPEIAGKTVTNQLVRVAGVSSSSSLLDANPGLDLDDLTPGAPNPTYQTVRSVNQVRSLVFESDGKAFVGGPFSDVIAHLAADGSRLGDLVLPRRAQCYALKRHGPSGALLALCLGTMTIEVFPSGASVPSTPLALGNDPTPGQVRRGRDIMLDGRISEFGRSSCFACHEGGRSDQLGWLIPGTPTDIKDVMVTQSLLSIEDTFPHHWRGERDMADFRKAFEGLLGAPAELAPTELEMRDVTAFVHSLKAPANPIQNPRRVLDDRISAIAPDGFPASAINGQELFRTVENFNGNTCAECHIQTTGSNANMLFEVGSFVPRAQEVEVAHLRQLQHKGLDTVFLNNGTLEVNENGFGATHNGAEASVFRFIFDTDPFEDAFNDGQRRSIASYVHQFDSGNAPGTHVAIYYRQGSPPRVEKDIDEILIQGAEQGWLDVVAFGRFHDGTALREARWLYDPAAHEFISDDAVLADKTWTEFKTATQAGQAQNAFMGVPWGNGFRVAFDPDFDDLATGEELALGTDPWKVDSDGDRWPDGYEVENFENPLMAQPHPGDEDLPDLDWAELDFVTARGAKWHARFTEDVTYVVEYNLPGGPVHTYRRDYFVRADTFVLTHASPSAPEPDELNKPVPDDLAPGFSATITLTDRAGKSSQPIPLLETFTPLAAQGQGGFVFPEPGVFPPLGSFLHVGGMTATVDAVGGDSLTATVTIATDYHYTDPITSEAFDADERVVVCTLAVQDPVTGDFVQSGLPGGGFAFTSSPAHVPDFPLWDFDGMGGTTETTFLALPTIPGPFVLCPPTVNGVTQFSFTQTGLTTPGQQVKVAVQAILIPVEIDDGMGGTKTVQWQRSLFHMQPLLTEDDAVDLSGPEFQGTAEVVVPF